MDKSILDPFCYSIRRCPTTINGTAVRWGRSTGRSLLPPCRRPSPSPSRDRGSSSRPSHDAAWTRSRRRTVDLLRRLLFARTNRSIRSVPFFPTMCGKLCSHPSPHRRLVGRYVPICQVLAGIRGNAAAASAGSTPKRTACRTRAAGRLDDVPMAALNTGRKYRHGSCGRSHVSERPAARCGRRRDTDP